ncbi:MAG TPA: hypothetical protein P5248_11230, partial [Bacteroidales bacterium]|nr:hypothetical protein [Bacteroidales bacterium]
DFRCFARSGSEVSHYLCSVYTSHWLEEEGVLIFEIRANRFLRNMVRAIVGTLLDIGRGRFALNALPGILASGSRSRAGTSAPAHGLFLWEVTYPREIYLESADCQSDVSGPSLSSPGLSR